MQNKVAYQRSKMNSEVYSSCRTKLEDFYDSERYFLTKEFIKPHTTILDIGCAGGG